MAAILGGPQIKLAGLTASADLSAVANQYKFVKISGTKTVDVCSAATDKPIGVLQNRPKSGEAAEIVCIGPTKVQADASITAGNLIGTSSDGQADPKTAGTDTTEYTVGVALDAPQNAGELISAVINCASPTRAA